MTRKKKIWYINLEMVWVLTCILVHILLSSSFLLKQVKRIAKHVELMNISDKRGGDKLKVVVGKRELELQG